MLQRCSEWQHIGRTVKYRGTVAQSIILPMACYQLSALATSTIPEANKIQMLVHKYLYRMTDFLREGSQKRGSFFINWYYLSTKNGGLGLSPVGDTINTCKMSLMTSFFKGKRTGQSKLWHTFIDLMCDNSKKLGLVTLMNAPSGTHKHKTQLKALLARSNSRHSGETPGLHG